jgi:hypothetical protein
LIAYTNGDAKRKKIRINKFWELSKEGGNAIVTLVYAFWRYRGNKY